MLPPFSSTSTRRLTFFFRVSKACPKNYFFLSMAKPLSVPPAELESILLQHPDIVDAAVIGIYSEAEATEFPRCVAYEHRHL
jgi:hypothetical protein